MSKNRLFAGRAKVRLIVSVEAATVAAIDGLLRQEPRHPARGNRSEFVRLAIEEKLEREARLE